MNWWLTDAFALGVEALFRRDDARTAAFSNTEYLAGLLNLHYAFSDVWDGTLKFAYAKQFDPASSVGTAAVPTIGNLTGAEQSIYQIALAGGYEIADGAKLKMEGRFDIVNPSIAGLGTEYTYGLALAFGYNF